MADTMRASKYPLTTTEDEMQTTITEAIPSWHECNAYCQEGRHVSLIYTNRLFDYISSKFAEIGVHVVDVQSAREALPYDLQNPNRMIDLSPNYHGDRSSHQPFLVSWVGEDKRQ